MALVVDTSALVYAMTSRELAARRVRRRLRDETVHAPHLIDAETGNVLRRQVLRGDLTSAYAEEALRSAPQLVDQRYEHTGALAMAAWSLRKNVTFYDALFAALAGALGVVLLTADERFAKAPGLPCHTEIP